MSNKQNHKKCHAGNLGKVNVWVFTIARKRSVNRGTKLYGYFLQILQIFDAAMQG